MKIVQNTLKIEEKFSDVPKKFEVGPKKVGSVGPKIKFNLFAIAYLPTLLPPTQLFFFFFAFPEFFFFLQFRYFSFSLKY